MQIHKNENLVLAFKYMKKCGVQMVNCGPEDITKGNEKIILGIIWNMIVHFQLGSISLDGISGKEGLLLWCQRMTKDYDDIEIKNFHRDWKNGRVRFSLFVHADSTR